MPPSRIVRAITIAFGAAAAAGAAQLGIGYGLGVFSWVPTVNGVDEAAWLASLAWTVWISATSVVIGTVAADRLGLASVGLTPLGRTMWRGTLAIAASLGGLIVVALTAVPARATQRPDTFAPQMIVGTYAVAGVIFGLVVALIAVNIPAIASNVTITSAWLWLVAVVATLDGAAANRDPEVVQLGVWQVTTSGPWFHSIYVPGSLLAAGSAIVIGALAAWPAANRGTNLIGVALSGAAGPAVIAGAYLLAAPVLKGVKPEQLSAHLVAPYAVIAGLIGSVLVAALAGAGRRRLAGRSANYKQPGAVSAAQPKVASDAV
ncbi:hypothetical protein [Rhizocola hellebori]|nr:hypothetical protein [Rhizocola hellebori]